MARLSRHINRGPLPSFLVVGTAKAGTTSLASYLNAHPALNIPRKESFYFNAEEFRDICMPYPLQRSIHEIIRTEHEYRKLFSGITDRMVGEIGTGYLYHHKTSIPRIRKVLGKNVKIIILLRNPVERAYSAYMHFRKDCFEDISFEEALEMEYYRQRQRWDFMWHYKSMGLYHDQVLAYKKVFPEVYPLFFEDLVSAPEAFMQKVFTLLGVGAHAVDVSKVANPSGHARFPWVQKFVTHEHFAKKLIRPVLRTLWDEEKRSAMRKYVKSKNLRPHEPMAESTRVRLAEFYARDVENLGKLLGCGLSHWIK